MNHVKLLQGVALALCLCTLAHAQTVYRIVGPDGKVTFSDKPPINNDQGKVATTGTGAAAAASGAALPYELRQVAAKYPVTLYAAPDCGPCGAGRSMLSNRGIPFGERSVTTQEDIDALRRMNGDGSLPFLTIGGQKIKGFSDAEWSQYLDAAGYPRTSALPSGYRNAGATPLVNVQKPVAAKAEEKPEQRPDPTTPPVITRSNPAGIQF